MKSSSILFALVLVCLAFAACNKPVEENASVKESKGIEAESTNEMHRKLPECAQRNKDGTYKQSGGCTQQQWEEWQKTQQ